MTTSTGADAGQDELFPWAALVEGCRSDPRIQVYVDRESVHGGRGRQLVDWDRVVAESSRDRAFREATALPGYREFAALAHAGASLRAGFESLVERSGPEVVRRFLSTRASLLLIIFLSWQTGSPQDLVLLAGQVAALALAPWAGLSWRAARIKGRPAHRLAATLIPVLSGALLAAPLLSGSLLWIGSIVVSVVFTGVAFVFGRGHTGRPRLRSIKVFLLMPALPGAESRSVRARWEWLADAREHAVMPELIQTINRLLRPRLDKRLLVQDTTRLRATHQADLLVETPAMTRLQGILRRSDGASVAVSGPRGTGKTTLLESLCASESRFCLLVSAPTHYVPKEFLVDLFQRLCTAYITDRGYSVERRGRLRRRGSLVRYLGGVSGLVLRIGLVAAFAVLLALSLNAELSHLAHVVGTTVGGGVDRMRGWTVSWWAGHGFHIRMTLVLLILLTFPRRNWRRLLWRSEPKLVSEARRRHQQLRAEQTATTQAGGGLGLFQSAFQRAVSWKTLPWTMPELVRHLSRFLDEITTAERARGRIVVIGIDEIDRMGSEEEAGAFLSEVKAVFGSTNCYFVVSIAAELGAAYHRRAIAGRTMVENAFDEIISLEPMSFELSRRLLQRRVPGFTDAFVWLGLALSGGLPRELIRVTRRLVEINMEHEYELKLSELADRMVREEIYEMLNGTRRMLSGLSLPPDRAEVMGRLREAARPFEPGAKLAELGLGLRALIDLRPTARDGTGMTDDRLGIAVAELSALALLDLTISDAFKDSCFDLYGTALGERPAGPYENLPAARRELSLSLESGWTAIGAVRAELSLPEVRPSPA